MILVAGHLRVAPGDRARLLAASLPSIIAARAAPGCMDFVVAPDPIEPDRVHVYERWTDKAALLAFRGSGPDDEAGALILGYSIDELEVVGPATPASTT